MDTNTIRYMIDDWLFLKLKYAYFQGDLWTAVYRDTNTIRYLNEYSNMFVLRVTYKEQHIHVHRYNKIEYFWTSNMFVLRVTPRTRSPSLVFSASSTIGDSSTSGSSSEPPGDIIIAIIIITIIIINIIITIIITIITDTIIKHKFPAFFSNLRENLNLTSWWGYSPIHCQKRHAHTSLQLFYLPLSSPKSISSHLLAPHGAPAPPTPPTIKAANKGP